MKRRRLPRLSRGWKLALSIPALLIAVCFLASAWAGIKKERWDPVREFRMAERSCWVGPSDIQCAGVGTYMDQVVILDAKYFLKYWPRDPAGPTLVPLYQYDFVAVDVPEGTARAELTLELSFYYFPSPLESSYIYTTYAVRERAEQEWEEAGPADLWQETYITQGVLQKEGGVLFQVKPKTSDIQEEETPNWDSWALLEVSDRSIYSQDPWENGAQAKMEAVFYDETGAELGRAELSTP